MAQVTTIRIDPEASSYIGPSLTDYDIRRAEWGTGVTLDAWVVVRLMADLQEGETNTILVPLHTGYTVLLLLAPEYGPFILE
jgi:hypothetical protein